MIPRDKFDLDSVRELSEASEASDEDIVDVADELLSWLEDSNWPVFTGVLTRLALVGDKLVEPIQVILNSNDNILKANIVGFLIPRFNADTQLKYRAMLEQLANSSNQGEIDEDAVEYARAQLASFSQNT